VTGVDVADPVTPGERENSAAVSAAAPDLPPSRPLELPDRGTIQVRDFGPADATTTILLLHGWTATADLNFFRCYAPLGEQFRVVAFDHRGHGHGLRSKKRFRLEDCADDAVAVADELGIDGFVPVGYSMGGPIAQLTWRRHRERVLGLVLCATAPVFSVQRLERLSFLGASSSTCNARRATGNPGRSRRLPATTGGCCSKRARPSARSTPRRGSVMSTSRRRWW
jgi:pimeloyl-ACP methyl ester carboxylesterase